MKAEPKFFTVRTETGEHLFVAFLSYEPLGDIGVIIFHRHSDRTDGSKVQFNVSKVELSSFTGSGEQILDLAIASFKERNWAERLEAQGPAIASFQDTLEIR